MKLKSAFKTGYFSPIFAALILWFFFIGCDSQSPSTAPGPFTPIEFPGEPGCDLNQDFLSSVLGRDVIPALTDPETVHAHVSTYIKDDDLVLGIEIDNQFIAIPHNILWHHEVINFSAFSTPISITYCPLTGSGLVFDRSDLGGVEFGVSGLLYRNNLVLFDRTTEESLWPQLSRASRCGPAFSTELFTLPVFEMTWDAWRNLHPSTLIISSNTGHDRDYTTNPYGNYDEPENRTLLFEMEIDSRRPPKERTLVLPRGEGGIAFPFGELDNGSPHRAIPLNYRGQDIVVFWSKTMNAAMAYSLPVESQARTFSTTTNDRFIDMETGSTWQLDGRAVSGPLSGNRLKPVANTYVAFWFAWAAFHPDTEIWVNTPSS